MFKRFNTSALVVLRKWAISVSPVNQRCITRESESRRTFTKLVEPVSDRAPEPSALFTQILRLLLFLRDQSLPVFLKLVILELFDEHSQVLQNRLDSRLDIHRIPLRLHQESVRHDPDRMRSVTLSDVTELFFRSELIEHGFVCDLREQLESSTERTVCVVSYLTSVGDARVNFQRVRDFLGPNVLRCCMSVAGFEKKLITDRVEGRGHGGSLSRPQRVLEP